MPSTHANSTTQETLRSICTGYWRRAMKDGSPTGYLEYVSQQTCRSVLAQIRVVLESIKDDDGVDAWAQHEWLSMGSRDEETAVFPKGDPIAAMRYGSNEGYFVEIISWDRAAGTHVLCCTIKYLTNKSFVYRVAQMLNDALWNGGFHSTLIDEQPQ